MKKIKNVRLMALTMLCVSGLVLFNCNHDDGIFQEQSTESSLEESSKTNAKSATEAEAGEASDTNAKSKGDGQDAHRGKSGTNGFDISNVNNLSVNDKGFNPNPNLDNVIDPANMDYTYGDGVVWISYRVDGASHTLNYINSSLEDLAPGAQFYMEYEGEETTTVVTNNSNDAFDIANINNANNTTTTTTTTSPYWYYIIEIKDDYYSAVYSYMESSNSISDMVFPEVKKVNYYSFTNPADNPTFWGLPFTYQTLEDIGEKMVHSYVRNIDELSNNFDTNVKDPFDKYDENGLLLNDDYFDAIILFKASCCPMAQDDPDPGTKSYVLHEYY